MQAPTDDTSQACFLQASDAQSSHLERHVPSKRTCYYDNIEWREGHMTILSGMKASGSSLDFTAGIQSMQPTMQ
eukprot:1162025-Pelagomonas_calceolata.AAC.1